jgi:hypothetical protein
MTIVFPPCVLDFAKSYVDRPPDYPVEALADWEAENAACGPPTAILLVLVLGADIIGSCNKLNGDANAAGGSA